jgi:hypothetical protein
MKIQSQPASQRHTLNHTTHSWPAYQLAAASRQRLSFAKTRFTCIFNNFARHYPNHYFPNQNSHLA